MESLHSGNRLNCNGNDGLERKLFVAQFEELLQIFPQQIHGEIFVGVGRAEGKASWKTNHIGNIRHEAKFASQLGTTTVNIFKLDGTLLVVRCGILGNIDFAKST